MKIIEPQTAKGPEDWFTGEVHPTIEHVTEAAYERRP
jgi:hypothetical protein